MSDKRNPKRISGVSRTLATVYRSKKCQVNSPLNDQTTSETGPNPTSFAAPSTHQDPRHCWQAAKADQQMPMLDALLPTHASCRCTYRQTYRQTYKWSPMSHNSTKLRAREESQ